MILKRLQFSELENTDQDKKDNKLIIASGGTLAGSAGLEIARQINKKKNSGTKVLKDINDIDNLKVGDVIRIHDDSILSNLKDIDHHLIYIGNGKVASKYGNGVRKQNLRILANPETFKSYLKEGKLTLVENAEKSNLTEQEILENINKALKEGTNNKYNFIKSNCEDFVNKMRGTKKGLSNTVKRHLMRTGEVALASTGLALATKYLKDKKKD